MPEQYLSILALISGLLLASFILSLGLERLRMPSLLAPLLIGVLFQMQFSSSWLAEAASGEAFHTMAQLGIIFLLFLVGLRLELDTLKGLTYHIALLSALNLGFSTLLGLLALGYYGYPLPISAIVSTALATVAEATIAPVLDELGVIRTRAANLILGPGVVDDVAEVILASLASLMVGYGAAPVSPSFMALGLVDLILLALIFSKFVLPFISRVEGGLRDPGLFLMMSSTALLFTFVSQFFGLGLLLGSITAGLTFQVSLRPLGQEDRILKPLAAMAYGLLGPLFFFEIGLGMSLSSLTGNIALTLLLLSANFFGKLLAALIVGRMAGLNYKAITVIGLGLSAKFSMGIIPVQILYSAGLIDQQLFTSFIAVSVATTMIIPFTLSYIITRWK
ncbi:cation:proton antiporter, partial [Candidatus Bathyarchaeota archaeon]|nr:cation:proton antiporter [Candidatus Bathyarchaeota archaeon]